MKFRSTITTALVCAAVLTPCVTIARDPAVVYESLMTPAGGGHGFVSQIAEIGQSITLQGPERHITQLDILLSSFGDEEFRVRFYGLNNLTGAPSNVIWESPIQESEFGSRIFSLIVPNIEVPQSMAYTVRPLVPTGTRLALRTGSREPSIGVHENFWYRYLGGGIWNDGPFGNGTYGAQVFAIPEPTSLMLIVAAALILSGRRFRISSPV